MADRCSICWEISETEIYYGVDLCYNCADKLEVLEGLNKPANDYAVDIQ